MDFVLEKLKEIRIGDYTYELPEEKIAKFPLADRDSSKLLVFDRGEIRTGLFSDVADFLCDGQTLVFNNTKVIHARLRCWKLTGAIIEIFCLEPYLPADYAQNFASHRSCEWRCMVGNLKKWKEGEVSCSFSCKGVSYMLKAEKIEQQETEVIIRFSWDGGLTFSEVLECCGQIPIPPYLNREPEESDEIRYQTVYSKEEGSVAAPTAGLHFSERILGLLKKKNITIAELTLHVGAGTFRPVKSEKIGAHPMHTEHIIVTRELVNCLRDKSGDLIAVGTTSVRTLESLYWMGVKRLEGVAEFHSVSQWEVYLLPDYYLLKEALDALSAWFDMTSKEQLEAETTIMIVPGYRFRVVDAMFTNFHQPQSTLLLLVAAAIGEDWRRVYDYAFRHGFRFLSYGDSSFLRINRNKV